MKLLLFKKKATITPTSTKRIKHVDYYSCSNPIYWFILYILTFKKTLGIMQY